MKGAIYLTLGVALGYTAGINHEMIFDKAKDIYDDGRQLLSQPAEKVYEWTQENSIDHKVEEDEPGKDD